MAIDNLSDAREAGRMLNELASDQQALRLMLARWRSAPVQQHTANNLWLSLQDVLAAASDLEQSLNKALDNYAAESAADEHRSDYFWSMGRTV